MTIFKYIVSNQWFNKNAILYQVAAHFLHNTSLSKINIRNTRVLVSECIISKVGRTICVVFNKLKYSY